MQLGIVQGEWDPINEALKRQRGVPSSGGGTPGSPENPSPVGGAARFLAGLNSPVAQLGMRMMANNQASPVRRGVGEIFAQSYLQNQEAQQQSMDQDVRQRYMQIMMDRMSAPQPQERKILSGPDGVSRYVDTGEPVFPGVTAPKTPPQTRQIERGGSVVTQEWGDDGKWADISTAPRWKPDPNGADRPPQIMNTANGVFERDPRTGAWKLIQGTAPTADPGKPIPPGLGDNVIGNEQIIGSIDEALGILGTDQGKAAVGSRNAMIDALTPDAISDNVKNWVDPNGSQIRAVVTNLNSRVVKERSGAAVTLAEFARQRGFLPTANDDARTLETKLRQLRQAMIEEQAYMAEYFESQGYRAPPITTQSKPGPGGTGRAGARRPLADFGS